jgi:hypothetical protein
MPGFKHRRFSANGDGYGRTTSISTVEGLEPEADRQLRARRWLYGTTSVFLAAVMVLGLIDAVGWADTYGVDTGRVEASGGGYDLSVRYGTVSRPALATPFEITVRRGDGFDQPVTLVVDRSYLEMWDENGLMPAPSAETTRGEWVEWEFDPPESDELTVFYDGRIEPAAQSGRGGSVAVLEDGAAVVSVEFHTRVLP